MDVDSAAPSRLDASIVQCERAAMLSKGVELALNKALEPILDSGFSDQILGSLLSNPRTRSQVLAAYGEDIRRGFQAELEQKMNDHNVVEQLAQVEASLNEWETKTDALKEFEVDDVFLEDQPDYFGAELAIYKQRMQVLEHSAQQYKDKIAEQHATIVSMITLVQEKRDEIDDRLGKTRDKWAELVESEMKAWSDSQVGKSV